MSASLPDTVKKLRKYAVAVDAGGLPRGVAVKLNRMRHLMDEPEWLQHVDAEEDANGVHMAIGISDVSSIRQKGGPAKRVPPQSARSVPEVSARSVSETNGMAFAARWQIVIRRLSRVS